MNTTLSPRPIGRDELARRLGSLRVFEVLGPRWFAQGHLPGARNMPPDLVLETAARDVPDLGAEIVVYCSNRACQNSTTAARQLAARGYRAVRVYEGGKQDWTEGGLRLEGAEVLP